MGGCVELEGRVAGALRLMNSRSRIIKPPRLELHLLLDFQNVNFRDHFISVIIISWI